MHIFPVAAAVFLMAGIILFGNDAGLLGNFVIISMLLGFMPFIIVAYFDNERMRAIEEHLPVFLRDVSEMQKAGTSLPDALRLAARTDYGKMSKEIKRMSDQLSWGVPLQEVLDRFSARMRKSEIIIRSIRILNEAYSSGGDIADAMESIATDVSMIREAKKERTSRTAQHITIMYIIYFIFIAIVIAISQTLFSMVGMNLGGAGGIGGMGGGFSNPCDVCANNGNIMCVSCSTFSILSAMFAFGSGVVGYYRALFFSMIIIQGIFSGLIAGQISSSSALSGLKHSLILTATGFGIFMIAFRLGMV